MGMKTSELINRLYNTTGVDFKAVHNKYKAPLAFGAGAITAGALLMPNDEKKHLTDALTRNQERYPEYNSLGDMLKKVFVPGAIGNIVGVGAGIALAKKGLGKNVMNKALNNKESVVVRPMLHKVNERFGDEKVRMAALGLAGYKIGDEVAALPFTIDQVKDDYHSGLKRYDGDKLRAGVGASWPLTADLGAGMYIADKMPANLLQRKPKPE
jgi:hypothetical protein